MEDAASNGKSAPAYLWFDAEFSSLELEEACLLQVAMLATDSNLNRLAPPEKDLNLFIRLESDNNVSPWVKENIPHIVQRCFDSDAVSLDEAEVLLCRYVDQVIGPTADSVSDRPIIAGNSIHNDWFLVRKYFPMFLRRTHYRLLDVSAFKTQWTDWFSGKELNKDNPRNIMKYFRGAHLDTSMKEHDAYYDIQASIAEMAFYRDQLVKKS